MARIVVVDDEAAARHGISRALTAAGHDVVVFENGRGAIADMEQNPPEVLITDIFMPEMDGIETIRRAHALFPELPIVAITGFAADEVDYLKMARGLGANASLKKPFRSAELCALVTQLLAARQ